LITTSSPTPAARTERAPAVSRFALVIGALTFLYLLPIWIARFLPFVDLPQHLSLVAILRDFHNPATDYSTMFSLRLYPTHNVLHLLVCYVLSFICGIETASRVFLSLYVIALPLALAYLLRTLNANRWLTLAGFLFIYNFNLFWGFVSGTFVIPAVLLILALELRELAAPRPNWARLSPIAALFVLTFLGHSLSYLFATALFLVLIALEARRGVRRFVPLLLTQLPVLLFFVIPWQFSVFGGEGGDLASRVLAGFSLSNLSSRLGAFFSSITARGDEFSSLLPKLLFVVTVSAAIRYAVRSGWRRLLQGRLRVATVLVLASLLGFLFFPAAIRQAWFLNERFMVFVCLFLVVLLGVLAAQTGFNRRWTLNFLLVVVIFNIFNLGVRFVAFDRQARPVSRLLGPLQPDRKIVGLMYEANTQPYLLGYDAFVHFANYYQLWKRGYPGFSFAEIRFSPIVYRDSTDYLPPGFEWSPWEWVFPEGWEVYDYFLVHGQVPLTDQQYLNALALVDSTQGWAVYRRQ
jgi:hypothetical protein